MKKYEGWATARVKVTVEVPTGAWGGDCTVDQVHRQAAESAVNTVANVGAKMGWRVVGTPEIVAVLTRGHRGATDPEPAAPAPSPPAPAVSLCDRCAWPLVWCTNPSCHPVAHPVPAITEAQVTAVWAAMKAGAFSRESMDLADLRGAFATTGWKVLP